MQLALGRIPATEYLPSLSKISPFLLGKMCLMLTERSPQEVSQYFNQLGMEDYARAGNRVKEDVLIHQRSLDAFQHPMESLLRSLGLMAITMRVYAVSKYRSFQSRGLTDGGKVLYLHGQINHLFPSMNRKDQ